MSDSLKSGTKVFNDRQDRWKHNSFHGHAVMMIANCNAIMDSKTTTMESKRIAQKIQVLAAELKISLKDRIK